ncbi:MAG: acylneuraminate cytidylyltransferase family protein [Candidatus Pacearchaeota archaeon]|jgi:CMP-N-acetylneuraminic acid synthetase
MKILALVPARGGSKGVPMKNISDLGGYPLIAHTIAAAKLSKLINRIIVTTDNLEIANISRKFGAEVPFLRPTEISGDSSTDFEFVKHTLDFLKQKEGYVPDFIIHLSPVIPLRDPEIIDKAIQSMIEDKEATALRSAYPYPQTGYKLTKIKNGYWEFFGAEDFEKGFEYYNLPRQALPKTYHPTCYVDIILPKTIEQTNTLHGKKIKAFIIEPTPDIDTTEDLENAREIFKSGSLLKEKLMELENGKLS